MLMDLSIHLVTWNVVGRSPSEDLHGLLGLDEPVDEDNLPDIYAIGLQEVSCKPQALLMDMLFEDAWSKSFKDLLAQQDYVKVRAQRLLGLLLLVFIRRRHLIHLRDIQTNYTRTGLGGVWGNKGGVSLRLKIYGCSICIVNCHLAAHDHELKQRIEDYNSIVDGQVFQDPETENILYHDYIFWIGDLNFRINDLSPVEIKALIDKKDYSAILSKDQLLAVMKSGEAFSEFHESIPDFPPSYKYIIGTDDYDLRRRPGWTDRIMYKYNPYVYDDVTLALKQNTYRAHVEYVQSDHKPVSANICVKVRGGNDRLVEFEAVDTWFLTEDNHCFYMLQSLSRPTNWDWIGLFRADFSSLDEYLTYMWAAPHAEDDQISNFRVTFPELNAIPGSYCLIYINNDGSSVLGMSNVFQIVIRE